MTIHCLNRCWTSLLTHTCTRVIRTHWINFHVHVPTGSKQCSNFDILITTLVSLTLKLYQISHTIPTVYPKKYAHGFCIAVLCCGYFPISIRLTSLALWQSNDCPSASKATLMNMDKYFMWIHYERLRNHNKAKHNKTVCTFLGIYCMLIMSMEPKNNRQWEYKRITTHLSVSRICVMVSTKTPKTNNHWIHYWSKYHFEEGLPEYFFLFVPLYQFWIYLRNMMLPW